MKIPDNKRHPCICPHCNGWISEHLDPYLKRDGWVRCGSCGYHEKRRTFEEVVPYDPVETARILSTSLYKETKEPT